MNFEDFKVSGCNSAWITEPNLDIYVRMPAIPGGTFRIEDISSTFNNNNALTDFLARQDAKNDTFFIAQLAEDKIASFL